jgi:hypothetical protein
MPEHEQYAVSVAGAQDVGRERSARELDDDIALAPFLGGEQAARIATKPSLS